MVVFHVNTEYLFLRDQFAFFIDLAIYLYDQIGIEFDLCWHEAVFWCQP